MMDSFDEVFGKVFGDKPEPKPVEPMISESRRLAIALSKKQSEEREAQLMNKKKIGAAYRRKKLRGGYDY